MAKSPVTTAPPPLARSGKPGFGKWPTLSIMQPLLFYQKLFLITPTPARKKTPNKKTAPTLTFFCSRTGSSYWNSVTPAKGGWQGDSAVKRRKKKNSLLRDPPTLLPAVARKGSYVRQTEKGTAQVPWVHYVLCLKGLLTGTAYVDVSAGRGG